MLGDDYADWRSGGDKVRAERSAGACSGLRDKRLSIKKLWRKDVSTFKMDK